MIACLLACLLSRNLCFFYVSRLTNHRGHHGRRQLIRVRGGGHGATAVHFARRHLRHVGTGRSHGIGHSHARVQAQHGDTAPTSTLQWHACAASYTSLTSRPPDRCSQWTVWFFDTSKQGFAGVLQHFVNLAFGVIFARSSSASECSWYLVNFTISVACGVVLLWGIMKGYDHCVNRYQITLLRSGEYGNPPSWKPWLAQLLIWGFFASGEKVLTAIVVIMPLHAHLDVFAAYIEQPLLDFPTLELLLVMVCAPVILNIGFFWVIDNIIMRKRAPNYLGNYLGHEFEGGLSAKRVPGDPNPFQLASHHAPTMPPHHYHPCGAGGDDDDQPLDKRPLLEDSCGCCPPFTPTQSPCGSYAPASRLAVEMATPGSLAARRNSASERGTELVL